MTGPFVSGVEINPDSEQGSEAIRFFLQQSTDSIPLRSTSQYPSQRFNEAVSHTAPLRINWRGFVHTPTENVYKPNCFGEIYRDREGNRLRCQSPFRAVTHNDVVWRFDYLRLWKRRGSGLPVRLGGATTTPLSPRPFSCDSDSSN